MYRHLPDTEVHEDVVMKQAALLDRVTTICLALPEVVADDRHPPHRGFVINKKNFAWAGTMP